jgi:cation diffusion facilitator family transporter
MDIFSSLISFLGIRISKKPADKEHPFGHWKFEVLAGIIITLILLSTGILILKESFKKFRNPVPIEMPFLALSIMAVSAGINLVMSQLKINVGKKIQ